MNRNTLTKMAQCPAEFRRHVMIGTDAGPVRLGDVLNDWQADDFSAMDLAWRRAAGHDVEVEHWRAWEERPRGHSKSQDASLMALWLLAFSRRRVAGVSVATDRDQAALIRNGIERLLSLNPWLQSAIDISQWKIVGKRTGSELTIMASDVASSWGLLIDFAILDEVSMWPSDAMWISLLSAAAKKDCLLLAAMNAGFQESWAYETRQSIAKDPAWHFSSLSEPKATWIDESRLDEQRRLLPPAAFARLWCNTWVAGSGDALSAEDIQAAVELDLESMMGSEPGHTFVGGLDLSTKRDHSALVILAAEHATEKIRVAYCRSWAPGPGGTVDLAAIRETCIDVAHRFRLESLQYDPYQAQLLVQDLRQSGIMCYEMPFTGKNLNTMASKLLEVFRAGQIRLYPDRKLIRDLGRLMIVEKSFGFKLEANRDPVHGHADTAFAFSIALPAAVGSLQYKGGRIDASLLIGRF